MDSNFYIDFQILGALTSPKTISKSLGIDADVELLRGERNKERDLPRQNIWSLKSKVNSTDLEEHWSELETVLADKAELIKSLSEGGNVKLTVVINSDGRLPSLIIPVSMSRFAGSIGAIIDIDQLQ